MLEAQGRDDRARQHPDRRLDRRPRHRDGDPQPQPGKPDTEPAGAPADRLRLRAEARPQRSICATGPTGDRDARASPTSSPSTRPMPTARCASARTSSSPPRRRAAISASSNTSRPGRWICAPRARSGSTPTWTSTGSTRCCFPARPAPRSPPRPAIRASRCRPALSPGSRDKETPDYPYGATFTGRAWSEPDPAAPRLRLRAGDPGAPPAARTCRR